MEIIFDVGWGRNWEENSDKLQKMGRQRESFIKIPKVFWVSLSFLQAIMDFLKFS